MSERMVHADARARLRDGLAQRPPGDASRRARPGLGIVERGALAARDGPHRFRRRRRTSCRQRCAPQRRVVDCEGRWITPGLIDCHTHLVYGGDRAREFELRLAGASYEEIARAGGGIVSTVARDARSERGRTRRASRCRGSTR